MTRSDQKLQASRKTRRKASLSELADGTVNTPGVSMPRSACVRQPNRPEAARLAHAYASTGRSAEAQKMPREWQHRSESDYISPYMIATVYASLGEEDKAFEYLEKAYQERSSDLPYFLRADLRIDSLRSDPRFQNLLRRMNFPK